MKIVILQGAFFPVPAILGGAVEKIWFRMGQEFAALGHEVIHIGRAHPTLPAQETAQGVQYVRVPGFDTPASLLKLKWLDLRYTRRALQKIPPDADVVVTNTFWAPMLLRGQLGRKVYVSVERVPKGQMWLYRRAARLRANSTPVAEAICRELPASQHQRVLMVPNPLPFHHLPALDVVAKKKVLLYVGRVHVEKGLNLLINAFQLLNTDWKLRIVGPWEVSAGGSGTAYLAELKQLAGAANIEFAGPVFDAEQLNRYYAEAAIFVYPSVAEQGETFGLAPLEAMAWGCAPVVSNLACFHDFITHEHNGLLFDHRRADASSLLANAITQLQDDVALRMRLAQQALAVRQSHSTASIASQFLQEFGHVIKEREVTTAVR